MCKDILMNYNERFQIPEFLLHARDALITEWVTEAFTDEGVLQVKTENVIDELESQRKYEFA